jgi:putative membrane protein
MLFFLMHYFIPFKDLFSRLRIFELLELMTIIKFLHVLCVFMWIGTLLNITRLMGYHVKESANVQARLAPIYERMNNLVGIPTMFLTIVFGFILLTGLDPTSKLGWFHMKLTFSLIGLVGCNLFCSQFIKKLKEGPDTSSGKKYKILHGCTGLFLIGVLIAIFVVRDKEGEMRTRFEKEFSVKEENSLSKIKTTRYDVGR